VSDPELERQLRKMSEDLKGLADSWEKTGMPTNVEQATERVAQFIKWLEQHRPDVVKKREQLKQQFPQLREAEG